MPKHLVIVESPAKCKTISKYLGKNYSVRATMGHIIDLPGKEFGVDIENDFKPKYTVAKGKNRILKVAQGRSGAMRTSCILRPTLTAKGRPLPGTWPRNCKGEYEHQARAVQRNHQTRGAGCNRQAA